MMMITRKMTRKTYLALLFVLAAAPFARGAETELVIPRLAQPPVLDGALAPGEWDGAGTVNGMISQLDGNKDPRPVTFWIACDETNVYVAQRSTVQPREWSPQTPPIFWLEDKSDNSWEAKGDSSFVIGLAPGRINRGDEPSHYLLRVNLHGQMNAYEITWKIKGVRLKFPHPPWQVKPEIKSAFSEDKSQWTSEVAIPLASMKVEAIEDGGETWGVLLARDYEAADQNANVVSSDWKFGDGRRHFGRAFYNHYRFAKEWAQAVVGTKALIAPRSGRSVREAKYDNQSLPDFSFTGYHKGGGLVVPTSELQQYGVYTGVAEKGLTATSYDPITGDFYAKLDIAGLPEAHKVVRGQIVIRKAGEAKPIITHPIPDFRADITLRMGQDHGPSRRALLEWVAPAAGAVDVAYECAQMYNVPAGRNDKVSFSLVHFDAAARVNTVLIPQQGLTREQGWVPYTAKGVQVARGDKIHLFWDNWDGNAGPYDDGRVRGKLTLTTPDGRATEYWPAGDFATKQGGTSGVWFYRFDDDIPLNADGNYPELKVQGHPQGQSGGYSGADWLWFPGNETKLNPWRGNPDQNLRRAWAWIRVKHQKAVRRVRFHLPDLAPGVYQATASAYARDDRLLGQARQNFIRFDHAKDLPWLGNQLGVTDQVLPPWTAIKQDQSDRTDLGLSVWGRTYRVDGSGLFTGIDTVTQSGIDQSPRDILAGPVRVELVQDGEAVTLTPAAAPSDIKMADHQASWQGALTGGGLRVKATARMEYDGYVQYVLSIVPEGNVHADRLRLVIPLKPEHATHLHAAAGDWFRSSVSSIALVTDNEQLTTDNRLWHSGQSHGRGITPSPKKWGRLMTVGDFKPYVWIGGANRGLAFMANDDQGWVPDDTKNVHAIEVVREGNRVNLILNLVARPFALDKPREIVFSLQATPIRPLLAGFRDRVERLSLLTIFPGRDKDGWGWNGSMLLVGEKKLIGGHGSQPYPLDWDRNIKKRKQWERQGKIFTPYQSQLNVMAFGEVDDPRMPPGKQASDVYGYIYPHIAAGCVEHGNLNIARPDFEYRLWCYQAWIKGCGLKGLYFDQTEPDLNANPAAGAGYMLDLPDRPQLHGRLQPGYLLTNTREFYKRLYTIFVENGVDDPMIWLHITDATMVSAFAFAGAFLDGENRPELTPDYPWVSEKYAPERMQAVTNPGKWGIGSMWLSMSARGWNWPEARDKQQISVRAVQGYARLHDYGDGWNYFSWEPFDRAKSMTFYPYWDPAVKAALKSDVPNVLAGAYRQDNRLQVFVFNRNKERREGIIVQIDAAALGLTIPEGSTLHVRDLKGWNQEEALPMNWQTTGAATGKLSVEIPPHDYRLLLLSAETGVE